MSSLNSWGWNASFADDFAHHCSADWIPARVLVEHRDLYDVWTEHGELKARVSGRMRYLQTDASDAPTVGDWVAVESRPGEGRATIHWVAPRRTALTRKEAGQRVRAHVLAANVDIAFLVTSPNQDYNERRMERFLAVVYDGGATPVVLLNKADLTEDLPTWLERASEATPGVPVHAVSALSGEGLAALSPYLHPGQTVVLLGSSGVGKSTLTNALMNAHILDTGAIRDDDARGRHTTSHRQMVQLPTGALLIDTPGLREVGLWTSEEGVRETFADIGEYASQCRFRDCTHESEPGCGVLAARDSGDLEDTRYQSYLKLQRELEYVERRHDVVARKQAEGKWKAITKSMRKTKHKKG